MFHQCVGIAIDPTGTFALVNSRHYAGYQMRKIVIASGVVTTVYSGTTPIDQVAIDPIAGAYFLTTKYGSAGSDAVMAWSMASGEKVAEVGGLTYTRAVQIDPKGQFALVGNCFWLQKTVQ